MLRLNSRRTPKPDGKKKKARDVNEQDEQVEEQGYSRKRDRNGVPEFVTDFKSSNLQGVAYDPEQKTMWIRFQNGAVYQYWNVPLNIYKNFWHAASKGKYFWEKIRRNYSIPYRRLTSSLLFIPIGKMRLSACRIVKSKAKLQLKTARNSITLYYNLNAAIQQLLDILHDLDCPGFYRLSDVELFYEGERVVIVAPASRIEVFPYGKNVQIRVDIEREDPIQFELPINDNLPLEAANEIFAFIESIDSFESKPSSLL